MVCSFWHISLAAMIVSFSLGGMGMADDVTLAQCPAPVQAAIQKHGQGGALEEIKLVKREDGTLYVAELGLGEKRDLKLHITPDGSVIKSRQEIVFQQAPAPVRRTVLGLLPPGSIVTDVDMEVASGTTVFVVEIKLSENSERKITMQPDGSVLSEHNEEK